MSGRIPRDISEFLVNRSNSRLQESPRMRSRDFNNSYEDDYIRTFRDWDTERDRDRSHGRPSRLSDMNRYEEKRNDRWFEAEEESDYYGDYRNRKSQHQRSREFSPERWKKPSLPPPDPRFRRPGFNYIDIMELFEKSNRNHREKG